MTDGVGTRTEVEPLSNYLVLRAQREITKRGAVGVLATAVNRDLSAPALHDDLPAQAYVAGVDGHYFLDGKRDWVIHGRIAGSRLQGSTSAISISATPSERAARERNVRMVERMVRKKNGRAGAAGNDDATCLVDGYAHAIILPSQCHWSRSSEVGRRRTSATICV